MYAARSLIKVSDWSAPNEPNPDLITFEVVFGARKKKSMRVDGEPDEMLYSPRRKTPLFSCATRLYDLMTVLATPLYLLA